MYLFFNVHPSYDANKPISLENNKTKNDIICSFYGNKHIKPLEIFTATTFFVSNESSPIVRAALKT